MFMLFIIERIELPGTRITGDPVRQFMFDQPLQNPVHGHSINLVIGFFQCPGQLILAAGTVGSKQSRQNKLSGASDPMPVLAQPLFSRDHGVGKCQGRFLCFHVAGLIPFSDAFQEAIFYPRTKPGGHCLVVHPRSRRTRGRYWRSIEESRSRSTRCKIFPVAFLGISCAETNENPAGHL